MSVDRPTFSENWYRVAGLKPRLRNDVQIVRQFYRGQLWHVLQDPANNQYFRLPEAGHRFVAMLDGHRAVGEVWEAAGSQLGDEAPTQPEAIQLLAQLYLNNLLAGDVPPDAEALFSRYRKRRMREVQSRLANVMFAHFPLLDPDRFLERWVGLVGWFFGPAGMVLWALVVGLGLWTVLGRFDELFARGSAGRMLSPENLPYLYIVMALIKGIHEFGHAFACKRIGRKVGTGGEVHEMGLMLLIFTPLPYVDASSSWSFRNKWHRIQVGIAGMWVEIFLAAIAAIVWARTGQGQVINTLAYNVIFIASVSTILFNANPLLRYDGYYILSDLLEAPNLRQRANNYIYYLVKKYAWGVRRPQNPAHALGERIWFFLYGIAATVYRVFISVAIILFVSQKFLLLGAIMAVVAVFVWGVLPLAKFVRYLFTGPELARVRMRAVATTLLTLAAVLGGVGLIPANDDSAAPGVVEPLVREEIRSIEDGRVPDEGDSVLADGTPVAAGDVLVRLDSEVLRLEQRRLEAELKATRIELRKAQAAELPRVAGLLAQEKATQENLAEVNQRLANLTITAPVEGVWVSPEARNMPGRFVRRGELLGQVVSLDRLEVRAALPQDQLDRPVAVGTAARIRRRGAADDVLSGTVTKFVEAAQEEPPPALTVAGGGDILLAQDPDGRPSRRAAEPFFDISIRPDQDRPDGWLVGQRVKVRFEQPRQPLLAQWYRKALQTVQTRFRK